jgi:dolichol-phosphate mannosyltransferase
MKLPITIVMPAKNEEESIAAVLCQLATYSDDVIVIDGHSLDRTVQVATNLGARVIKDNKKGKGDAVRIGLEYSKSPVTLFIDADGSHDPKDIPKLVLPILEGKADLVIGSRMRGGSDELFGTISEAIRLAGQVFITLVINYRFGVRMTDYQNGFRAIRTSVGQALVMQSNLPTIEQEMAMKCLQYGYRVEETPSHEYSRTGGISKINPLELGHRFVLSLIAGVFVFRKKSPTEIITTRIEYPDSEEFLTSLRVAS